MHRFVLSLALVGCAGGPQPGNRNPVPPAAVATAIDADGDGVPAEEDCDDADVGSAPGLPEIRCDGRDNDCVGGDDRSGCEVSEAQVAWTFPIETGATATSVHSLGDLDGDGGEDLAIAWTEADDSRFVTVVTGIATGAPQVLRFDDAAMVWAAGDVDGDGDGDLWVGKALPDTYNAWDQWASQLRLARGPVPASGIGGTEEIGFDGYFIADSEGITSYDMNGDPLSESWDIYADLENALPRFFGAGWFADYDGDGVMDVIYDGALLSPAEAVAYSGDYVDYPERAATTRPGLPIPSASQFLVGDVDGDGAAEVLTFDLEHEERWVVARVLPGPSVPSDLAGWNFAFVTVLDTRATLADLDGDGRKDVVFVKPDGGEAFSGASL